MLPFLPSLSPFPPPSIPLQKQLPQYTSINQALTFLPSFLPYSPAFQSQPQKPQEKVVCRKNMYVADRFTMYKENKNPLPTLTPGPRESRLF